MDLMKQALTDAGFYSFEYMGGLAFNLPNNYRVGGKFVAGVFTITEGTYVSSIKRAYSTLAVKQAAKKMGWTVKQDAKNPLKMQISRRS